MVEQGEQAPDFALPDQDGNRVTLSELSGEPGPEVPALALRLVN